MPEMWKQTTHHVTPKGEKKMTVPGRGKGRGIGQYGKRSNWHERKKNVNIYLDNELYIKFESQRLARRMDKSGAGNEAINLWLKQEKIIDN